jgi:hypothetical protein
LLAPRGASPSAASMRRTPPALSTRQTHAPAHPYPVACILALRALRRRRFHENEEDAGAALDAAETHAPCLSMHMIRPRALAPRGPRLENLLHLPSVTEGGGEGTTVFTLGPRSSPSEEKAARPSTAASTAMVRLPSTASTTARAAPAGACLTGSTEGEAGLSPARTRAAPVGGVVFPGSMTAAEWGEGAKAKGREKDGWMGREAVGRGIYSGAGQLVRDHAMAMGAQRKDRLERRSVRVAGSACCCFFDSPPLLQLEGYKSSLSWAGSLCLCAWALRCEVKASVPSAVAFFTGLEIFCALLW